MSTSQYIKNPLNTPEEAFDRELFHTMEEVSLKAWKKNSDGGSSIHDSAKYGFDAVKGLIQRYEK